MIKSTRMPYSKGFFLLFFFLSQSTTCHAAASSYSLANTGVDGEDGGGVSKNKNFIMDLNMYATRKTVAQGKVSEQRLQMHDHLSNCIYYYDSSCGAIYLFFLGFVNRENN